MKKHNLTPPYLSVYIIFFFFTIYTQIKNNFTSRFSESVKGSITMIANNMLFHNATSNFTGAEGNHDFIDNVFIDIDNTTLNSSNATFTNPKPLETCLNIKKAYLYWAVANYKTDTPLNKPNWNLNKVKNTT